MKVFSDLCTSRSPEAEKASDDMLSIMVQMSIGLSKDLANSSSNDVILQPADFNETELISRDKDRSTMLTVNFDLVVEVRRKVLVNLLRSMARTSTSLPVLLPLSCCIAR